MGEGKRKGEDILLRKKGMQKGVEYPRSPEPQQGSLYQETNKRPEILCPPVSGPQECSGMIHHLRDVQSGRAEFFTRAALDAAEYPLAEEGRGF